MEANFLICCLLGLSGIVCSILYDMNKLINEAKPVNFETYLKRKKYSLGLALIFVIQAAYFRDLYLNIINKQWDFSKYSLAAFWICGLFAQSIMNKIIYLGNKYFNNTNGNGSK